MLEQVLSGAAKLNLPKYAGYVRMPKFGQYIAAVAPVQNGLDLSFKVLAGLSFHGPLAQYLCLPSILLRFKGHTAGVLVSREYSLSVCRFSYRA